MSLYHLYDSGMMGAPVLTAADTTQFKGMQLGQILSGLDISPAQYGEAEFRYVKFSATVNRNDFVVVNFAAFTAVQTVAASRGQVGIAMAAQVANQFGWVMIRGVNEQANVLSGVAADAQLFLTTTAGQLSGTSVAAQKVDTGFERLIASTTGVTLWVASTFYQPGQVRKNGANIYSVIDGKGGTSAASGGPTGTAQDITDGTVHWQFEGTAIGTVELNWASAGGNT